MTSTKHHCPICAVELEEHQYRGVPLEVCRRCGGLWLSNEHTLALTELLKEKDLGEDLENVADVERAEVSDSHTVDRKCPTCGVSLREFNYASDSDIYIDRCDSCHGIWIDGHEVSMLSRFLESDPRQEAVGKFIFQHDVRMRSLQEFMQFVEALKTPMSFPYRAAARAWGSIVILIVSARRMPLRYFIFFALLIILLSFIFHIARVLFLGW